MPARRATKQPDAQAATEPLRDRAGKVYAGTSGWAYATWKPGFYPAGVSTKKYLSYYSSQLNSVEVNYTFRQLPSATMLAGWLNDTSPDFRFSFKAPQQITHFKRLRECEAAVEEFVTALAPAREAGKLGPLLFQLPPNFKADAERLRGLLCLPSLHGLRVAFEFRHESWFVPGIFDVLRDSNAALCVAESDGLVTPEVHTAADFGCFRLRQDGGYSAVELAALTQRIHQAAADGREIFAYFKHEDEPTGALNAVALLKAMQAGTA